MHQLHFACRNFSRLTIVLVITVSFLTGIISCTGKSEKEEKKPNFDADCMTLTKAQINKYWAPKFTDPGKPEAERIAVIKFYSSPVPGQDGYYVSAQAFNNADKPIGDPIDLNPGVTCGVKLPPLVVGHSNDLDISNLKIFNPDGSLLSKFSKIIIVPSAYAIQEFDFLKFEVSYMVGDSRSEPLDCLPCPPCANCKPACQPDCKPACIVKDTTRQDTPLENKSNDTLKSK